MENSRVWRASVVIPDEIADRVYKMRQTPEFERSSVSEILRALLVKGLEYYGYNEAQNEDRPA